MEDLEEELAAMKRKNKKLEEKNGEMEYCHLLMAHNSEALHDLQFELDSLDVQHSLYIEGQRVEVVKQLRRQVPNLSIPDLQIQELAHQQ